MALNTNLHYCLCNVIQCGKRPGESHEGVGPKKMLVKNCPCQGLRCVVAMLASELLRLPAFKLSRLSCEVAMFVCQVPQLSGFKL